MNIWLQFNLANHCFLSDWRIYIGERYYILYALGNKKEFNLADFCNFPYRQNKFSAKL